MAPFKRPAAPAVVLPRVHNRKIVGTVATTPAMRVGKRKLTDMGKPVRVGADERRTVTRAMEYYTTFCSPSLFCGASYFIDNTYTRSTLLIGIANILYHTAFPRPMARAEVYAMLCLARAYVCLREADPRALRTHIEGELSPDKEANVVELEERLLRYQDEVVPDLGECSSPAMAEMCRSVVDMFRNYVFVRDHRTVQCLAFLWCAEAVRALHSGVDDLGQRT